MRTKNLTNSEVLHRWAQQSEEFKDITLYSNHNTIKCINNKLYKNDLLIGIFIKKDIVFINNSDFSSGWGNSKGICTFDIKHAIYSDVKKYEFSKLLENYSNDNTFIKWFVDQALEYNEIYLNKISHYERFIKGEVRKLTTYRESNFTLPEIPDYLLKNRIRKIKSFPIDYYYYGTYYKGWNTYYNKLKIKTTISKLLKNDLSTFFNSNEIKEINFQIWREKYGRELSVYDNLIPKEKIRGVYNDPVAKIKREELVTAYNKGKIEKQHLKNQVEHIKNVYSYYNKLSEWLIGNSSRFNNNTSLYPFSSIKLVSSINADQSLHQRVITSLSVIITIEQAKLAYNLFKRYKQDDNSDINLTDKGFVIDNYKVKGIYKHTYNKPTGLDLSTLGKTLFTSKPPNVFDKNSIEEVTELALTIGCHTIPESEIIRFINDNNLNWNE